jgi:hypothetical protein
MISRPCEDQRNAVTSASHFELATHQCGTDRRDRGLVAAARVRYHCGAPGGAPRRDVQHAIRAVGGCMEPRQTGVGTPLGSGGQLGVDGARGHHGLSVASDRIGVTIYPKIVRTVSG